MGDVISHELLERKKQILISAPHLQTIQSGNTSDSKYIAHFKTDLAAPIKSLKINFLPIQEGSGDPSPDNIREIKGWTDIKLTKCGINLLQCDTFTNGNINGIKCTGTRNANNEIESISIVGSSSQSNNFRNLNYTSQKLKWPPCGKYASYGYSPNANVMFCTNSSSFKTIDGRYPTNDNISRWEEYNIPQFYDYTSTWMRIQIVPANPTGIDINSTVYPLVCLLQDEGCEFQPYEGQTIMISLPSTFYGGYIDLTKGELVETMKLFSTEWGGNYMGSATRDSTTIRYFMLPTFTAHMYNVGNNICNITKNFLYKYSSDTVHFYHHNDNIGGYLYLALPNETSDDTIIQFAYDLLSPITYTLSPQIIKTLKGVNNMWSTANGKIELSYWTY